MQDVFICDYIRTPIGRFGGALSSVRADDLGAIPLRALMARNTGVDWEAVDDVIFGCANQAGEDNRNVARMSSLLAGLPVGVTGMSRAFSDADLKLVSDDIVQQCDENDGLKDGLVLDPASCEYDPSALTCTAPGQTECLSADQVHTLTLLHARAHDSAGNRFYVPWPYDPAIGSTDWRRWRLVRTAVRNSSTFRSLHLQRGRGDLQRGAISERPSGLCGGHEPAGSGTVFNVSRDPVRSEEDQKTVRGTVFLTNDVVFGSAGLQANCRGPAPEAGSVYSDPRGLAGGGPDHAAQAAAYGEACV